MPSEHNDDNTNQRAFERNLRDLEGISKPNYAGIPSAHRAIVAVMAATGPGLAILSWASGPWYSYLILGGICFLAMYWVKPKNGNNRTTRKTTP